MCLTCHFKWILFWETDFFFRLAICISIVKKTMNDSLYNTPATDLFKMNC